MAVAFGVALAVVLEVAFGVAVTFGAGRDTPTFAELTVSTPSFFV